MSGLSSAIIMLLYTLISTIAVLVVLIVAGQTAAAIFALGILFSILNWILVMYIDEELSE